MFDKSKILESFTVDSFDNPAEILEEAALLSLLYKDNPELPPRSDDQKLEDSIVGLLPELHGERCGLRRAPKYRDLEGEGFDQHFLNGRTEWKTIRVPTLKAAQNALRYAGNKDFDHAIIWHCDRSIMLYRPYCVFKRSDLVNPILFF
jgi:hypothetical protein